jgi:predicted DNA-binding transcriptional regulator AlpA
VREVASGDIRVLAEAVVDVLEERGLVAPQGNPGRVLSVPDVAELLGRSRPWVYEHAAELGAFRFGTGPKARIGFEREAIERWKRERQILKPTTPSQPQRRDRPRRTARSSGVSLIPYDPSPRRA